MWGINLRQYCNTQPRAKKALLEVQKSFFDIQKCILFGDPKYPLSHPSRSLHASGGQSRSLFRSWLISWRRSRAVSSPYSVRSERLGLPASLQISVQTLSSSTPYYRYSEHTPSLRMSILRQYKALRYI